MDTKVKKILITGGAGFMGRWTAKNLLDKGHKIWILDNLSNGFENNFDICVHFAAAIDVQDSIDNPEKNFNDNCVGAFNVLEQCKKHNTKIVFISSALVYKTAESGQKITEEHPLNASSVIFCP